MRLVVGYLATPSGEDGLALGAQLARSLGAQLDICMVLPPDRTVPARVPAETGYDDILASRAQRWLDEAKSSVPSDIDVDVHLSFHESFAQGILDEVTRLDAHAIVVGAAGDGLLGRHSVGSVSTELLHSAHVPLCLAPRGYRHSSAKKIREVTCALGTRTGGRCAAADGGADVRADADPRSASSPSSHSTRRTTSAITGTPPTTSATGPSPTRRAPSKQRNPLFPKTFPCPSRSPTDPPWNRRSAHSTGRTATS